MKLPSTFIPTAHTTPFLMWIYECDTNRQVPGNYGNIVLGCGIWLHRHINQGKLILQCQMIPGQGHLETLYLLFTICRIIPKETGLTRVFSTLMQIEWSYTEMWWKRIHYKHQSGRVSLLIYLLLLTLTMLQILLLEDHIHECSYLFTVVGLFKPLASTKLLWS